MSVPLQSVPENREDESPEDEAITRAKHEAAEIVARAHRQAESITAEARSSASPVPSPLAALGDNAEEIIGQVRKLIRKQRELQSERQGMLDEIESLKGERDELVQRLTDAVERMEELASMAEGAQSRPIPPQPAMASNPPPPPPVRTPQPRPEPAEDLSAPAADTSLAARLRQAEREEAADPELDDSSLAARLERAERERNARAEEDEAEPEIHTDDEAGLAIGADGRSFYDRHSAKLPRLEGDGGRSVLSAIGDMRPESEPKGRKGRRRNKK